MAEKRPEGPIGWSQTPAQGAHEDDDYGLDVDEETEKHGDTPVMVSGPNGNQGGN